jgi:tripeptidyl-peptidase I
MHHYLRVIRANKCDVQKFLQITRPDLPQSTTFALQTLDGGSDPQGGFAAGDEAVGLL